MCHYWVLVCVCLERRRRRRLSLIPSARLKNSTAYFPTCSKVDIQSARQEEKKRQCGLCLELRSSGEHYNQLLPSQTSFSILCCLTLQQLETIAFISLCLHSQIRATLDFLSLSGLFFSSFFCSNLPWQCIHQRGSWAESHLPFPLRANEC